ncbi:hypothetical protein [Streptomyces sp. NPDC058964]|uniref:hypothetical protein n=1 Tax=Streptomyces sp. NPDC058964 TaxID=3346681 RepID=UPI0036B163FC
MLEAVLCPEWADRCHSFDAHWSETESMASTAVRHVLASRPPTEAVVAVLNADMTPADLAEDIAKTGCPRY